MSKCMQYVSGLMFAAGIVLLVAGSIASMNPIVISGVIVTIVGALSSVVGCVDSNRTRT